MAVELYRDKPVCRSVFKDTIGMFKDYLTVRIYGA